MSPRLVKEGRVKGELGRRLSRLELGQREGDWTDNCLSPTRSNGQNGVVHNMCFGIRDNWAQKLPCLLQAVNL